MARGFGTTFGIGTTDAIQSGSTAPVTILSSFSIWVNLNGIGGGTFGSGFRQGSGAVGLYAIGSQSSTTQMAFRQPFSTVDGNWLYTVSPANKWHHVCGTFDGNSSANTPIVYVDGISASLTNISIASGTFGPQTTNFFVGNSVANNRNWDGMLAEMALWNVILTANEAISLASGTSPFKVRPTALTLYLPLFGRESGEQDWGPNHSTQTLTGTKYQDHPPIDLFKLSA